MSSTEEEHPSYTLDHIRAWVPQFKALEWTLLQLRTPDEGPMCEGCLWESVIKPIVSMHIGWSRGYGDSSAYDPFDEFAGWIPLDWDELDAHKARQEPAKSDFELWLRTPEAYDLATDHLLAIADRLDPGRGHGLP